MIISCFHFSDPAPVSVFDDIFSRTGLWLAGRLLENVDGWPIGSLAFCKLISWVELDFAEILLNINFILPNFCLGIRFLKFFAEGGFVTFLAEEIFFSFFWSCKLSISWFFLFLLDLGPGLGGLEGTVRVWHRKASRN